ncbi:MAG: IS200/IS605 family transposase [Verrucomicrobiota bacterium JB022]|nr:IS200/IS605 family transposase [Verrucomicrobiota bacterium JB022]
MRSTYHSLYYHLVFSTKYRRPSIRPEWRARLHEYLGGTAKGLGEAPLGVGGTEDHVHLLLGLRTTSAPARFVQELKKASTRWMQEKHDPTFAWQQGYAIFSVSVTHLSAVQTYISDQEAHHREVGFEEEFQKLLLKHGLEYEPPYPERGDSLAS